MAEMLKRVVDASVASRWFLRDEKYVGEALRVLGDFEQGRIQIYAPDLIRHEVASALSKATRRLDRPQRPSLLEGWQSVARFLSLGVELAPDALLAPTAFTLAGRYGCSYYDALYLALGQALNCPVVYADEKLRRTLRNQVPHALWIENYLSL